MIGNRRYHSKENNIKCINPHVHMINVVNNHPSCQPGEDNASLCKIVSSILDGDKFSETS